MELNERLLRRDAEMTIELGRQRARIERLEAALRGAQEALGEGEWITASDILFDALTGKEGT